MLSELIKRQCTKQSMVDYSRLVIDCSVSDYINFIDNLFTSLQTSMNILDAMEKRKTAGITAPTVLIIGTQPQSSFFIAADDMSFQASIYFRKFIILCFLQVRGRYADALQSFMEIVYVCNVQYDPKTTPITYFFEALMNITTNNNTRRMDLKTELETIKGNYFSQKTFKPPYILATSTQQLQTSELSIENNDNVKK